MNCGTEEYGWICLVQDMEKCWAVVHTKMNLLVPYLLTGRGAVGFSRSTVVHGVCFFLYVLVRRMVYSLCGVCCTGLCSHSAALHHLQHLQSSTQPTSRCDRYKLSVICPYNCNLDHLIINVFEFSVRWNIRMRRQMIRHASSTVVCPRHSVEMKTGILSLVLQNA